jgi:hypothetical protein
VLGSVPALEAELFAAGFPVALADFAWPAEWDALSPA